MYSTNSTWSEGFHTILSKCVVILIFASGKTYNSLGEHTVLDQEATYDRVLGVLVINRYLDLPDVLSTETYPPSMTGTGPGLLHYYPDGNMRMKIENPISIKTFKWRCQRY